MRRLFFLVGVLLSVAAFARVHNVKVNGIASPAPMAPGDEFRWSVAVDRPGDTVVFEIKFDVNRNGTRDQMDVLVGRSYVIDGRVGLPGGFSDDSDAVQNGRVSEAGAYVGLAAGQYLLSFWESGQLGGAPDTSVVLTVTPFAAPPHTITGHITFAALPNKPRVLVYATDSAGAFLDGVNFWSGVSDSLGNFTIPMSAAASGRAVRVELSSDPPFQCLMPSSVDTIVHVTGVVTTVALAYSTPGACLHGTILDNSTPGRALIGSTDISASDASQVPYAIAPILPPLGPPGTPSTYSLPMEAVALGKTLDVFFDGAGFPNVPNPIYMHPRITTAPVTQDMSLLIRVPIADATITGTAKLNGVALTGVTLELYAWSDSAFTHTKSDSASGRFTLRVSSRVPKYHIDIPNEALLNFGPNAHVEGLADSIAEGASSIDVNISTINGVVDPAAPSSALLGAPYPNPASNVVSAIWTGSKSVSVELRDVLGRLVRASRVEGTSIVRFDASTLPAGLYWISTKGDVSARAVMVRR